MNEQYLSSSQKHSFMVVTYERTNQLEHRDVLSN